MKKILILFLFIFFTGSGQSGLGTQQVKNIISMPTSANAYALDKMGKLQLDLFRGKANISIPIYTISIDGINIPISLSYNTGGIKLNEVATIVGLGWSLDIPNNITQNIIGLDDKYTSLYTKDINLVKNNVRNVGAYDNDIKPIVEGLYLGNYDTKPDIFNYNLPTVNGSFIVNNNIGYTIPQDDIKIESYNNLKNFKIKDKSGNTFFLSPKNIVTYDNGETGPISSESFFTLDSIRTISNSKITFIYNKTMTYKEKVINERANYVLTQQPSGNYEASTPPPPYERFEGSSANVETLLTKIIFPEGEIIFQYSDDGNLNVVPGESNRKDLNSQNGVALRKILVKNISGIYIKDLILNYSYFESSNPNKSYNDYRLKLINIFDSLTEKKHEFSYIEDYALPARSTSNDDYWGYINNLSGSQAASNIPSTVYTDYVQYPLNLSNSRNRETNSLYSKLGTLNKITYPTKGSKELYYEPNTIFQKRTNLQKGLKDTYVRMVSKYPGDGVFDNSTDIDTLFTIPSNVFTGKDSIQVKLSFGNSCKNNNDNTSQIHETLCFGSAKHNGNTYGSNGKPKEFILPYGSQFKQDKPIRISLNRTGNCRCSYSVDIIYNKYTTFNSDVPVGGLRIKKVEDVDEQNSTNILNYTYKHFDQITNSDISSGALNQPFQYTYLRKRFIRQIDPATQVELGDPYLQKYLVVSNSSGSYNSYGSSDIVTYSKVTESNGLGKIVNIFTQNNSNQKLYSHEFSKYSHWKDGLLKKTAIINSIGDTLNIKTNEYIFNDLKNPLSGFSTDAPQQIAFAYDVDITKHLFQANAENQVFVEGYLVEKKIIPIESGKIENIESKTIEYFPNSIMTVSKNIYYDTEINKPINLRSTEIILASGEKVNTTYSYAHEKGNQLMIDRNMIGIPLETVSTQTIGNTTKTLSRSETIYPTSVPTSQSGNLVLPLSVKSYDVLNNNASYTEATYDKYDSKGNLQQYTTKDGISTVIIWGYDHTQPIAKIEGAQLSGISQSLIDTIVNASNTDAQNGTETSEQNLISALDTFRSDASLSGYQISTYTYDPLIGVRSITPPSGIREYYRYDTANRLEKVIDSDKKVLKEFKYNYKN
ncbi:hypothetical protein [Chryseobacterium camelliae]|uniref:hypothetical protein n=1 Tax=Chryseobacterium camelliae TaxID=1265445 RepID=UPI0028600679|nr:hypothetical protein [Chryseobacterium camelliae]MDR6516412.1 hypothetical protein [Chryseobacterium camelliae]